MNTHELFLRSLAGEAVPCTEGPPELHPNEVKKLGAAAAEISRLQDQDEVHWKTRNTLLAERDAALLKLGAYESLARSLVCHLEEMVDRVHPWGTEKEGVVVISESQVKHYITLLQEPPK